MYTFCLPASCREHFAEVLEELRTMRHDSRLPPPAVFEGLSLLGDNLIIRLMPEFKPSEVVAKITDYGTLIKYSDGGIPRYPKFIKATSLKSYTNSYVRSGIVVEVDNQLYKLSYNLFNELQMKNFYNQIREIFKISAVSLSLANKIGFKPFEANPTTTANNINNTSNINTSTNISSNSELKTAFDFCYDIVTRKQFCSIRQSKTTGEMSTAQVYINRSCTKVNAHDSEYTSFCTAVLNGFDNPNGFEIRAVKQVRENIAQNTIHQQQIPMYFALINAWYLRVH